MKTALLIAVLVAITGVAGAAETSLTTIDGKTYDHISTLRVDPDGVYIEYTVARGGLGSAKVKFARLSTDLQKQYGYDADAARKYEEGTARAELAYQNWAKEQDAARQRAQSERDARELEEETLATQRQVAAAQVAQAAAQSAQGSGDTMPYYAPNYGYGYGFGIGRAASRHAWTGEMYQGIVPYGTLFTPLGYQPTKPQFTPATPRSQPRSGNSPVAHESEMHRF